MKTEITIRLHEDYTQTTIRRYGKHAMDYVEYSVHGASFLGVLKTVTCVDDLLQNLGLAEDVNYNVKYNNGLNRFVLIRYFVPEDNINDIDVKEARSISIPYGGKSIRAGLTNEKLKLMILHNVITQASKRDIVELVNVIEALEKVGGTVL